MPKKRIVISWSVYSISAFETWLNMLRVLYGNKQAPVVKDFRLKLRLQNSQFVGCQNDDYKRHRSEILLFSGAIRTCNSVGSTYINLYNTGILLGEIMQSFSGNVHGRSIYNGST